MIGLIFLRNPGLFQVWGLQTLSRTVERGKFCCPQCGPNTGYAYKWVWMFIFFHLIPVIPLQLPVAILQCQHCHGTSDTPPLAVESAFHSPSRWLSASGTQIRPLLRPAV